MEMQTVYEFELPKGYVDGSGESISEARCGSPQRAMRSAPREIRGY